MDRLPIEVIDLIASFLPQDSWLPSKRHAARYAAISSRWQQAVEPRTFEKIDLDSTQLDALACVLTPRRCRYAKRIYFTVVIPHNDPAMQPTAQKAHLCKVMTNALRRLFQILAQKSDPSDVGVMMLRVAHVEFPVDVDPPSPRPFYKRDALDLVDWDDLPVVPCISELLFHEHQGERRLSLRTGLKLASRLPNLSRLTLGTLEWSSSEFPIIPNAAAVRSWRHKLAATFADERLAAGLLLRHATLEDETWDRDWACPGNDGFVPPSYCVAASEEAGAPQHDPLGAAIRDWSQNLYSLEISGSVYPHWPNLETLTTDLSPCSPDGTCYFTRDPSARRVEVHDGYEISLPPPGHPNDDTLQPLFASWARALAQMPRLREATLCWNLKLGWPGCIEHVRDRMWAVSFLAPGTPPKGSVHFDAIDDWRDPITPDEARRPRLLFYATLGWRPWEGTMGILREVAGRRFPGTGLVVFSVDTEHQMTRE
ncbi:hypothetical protein PG985_009574 [Apiospora marii]|uniref:F-box domain-containing protein n=1 Tax=Apiospora marii TaxID=335849 RepID=A0ABR1RFQ0_9PEZI